MSKECKDRQGKRRKERNITRKLITRDGKGKREKERCKD